MITKNKALAYIFRINNGERELLVFDHHNFPEVNPQVPAGTVDRGESHEAAVLREVFEESGKKLDKPSLYLGCFDYHRKDINELHKRHVYLFETEGLEDKWQHVVSSGEEDKDLTFNFYWLSVDEARDKLVGSMGAYLSKYQFKSLSELNLQHIEKWLEKPHVKEFWDEGVSWKESREKYLKRISSDTVKQFLVHYENTPIGYIQFYWASKVGDGWWEGYPEDVVGMDLYIGESNFVGKGHGNKIICEFINYLKRRYEITKIIVDPSPHNLRAISSFEKVGFKKVDVIKTPDGKAVLMELEI